MDFRRCSDKPNESVSNSFIMKILCFLVLRRRSESRLDHGSDVPVGVDDSCCMSVIRFIVPAETNRPSGTDEVSESVSPTRTKSLSVVATTMKGWKPSSKGCWENSHRPLPCSTPNSQMRRFCRGRHSVSFSGVTRTSDDWIFV